MCQVSCSRQIVLIVLIATVCISILLAFLFSRTYTGNFRYLRPKIGSSSFKPVNLFWFNYHCITQSFCLKIILSNNRALILLEYLKIITGTLKNYAHLNRGGHDCGRSFANEAANIAQEAVVSLFLWHLVQI